MRLRTLRLVGLIGFTVTLTMPSAHAAWRKPAKATKPRRIIKYRFKAQITDNGGITPFKINGIITGLVVWDLKATRKKPHRKAYAQFDSRHNSIEFKHKAFVFRSKGPTELWAISRPRSEKFAIGVHDLTLPKGWAFIPPGDGTKDVSRSFSIVFENEPKANGLDGIRRPRLIVHSKFSKRQFRFSVFHGLRFPGGMIPKRAHLRARIDEFTLAR